MTAGTSYFRPDIEGLRAIAIAAVLLFHAGIPGMDGGFVGVDVFFVISGFLITGLLLRELAANGDVSLTRFYARRARRLLPAALVVIAITVIASFFILSVVDFPSVAADGAAAALYVSNYRFAVTATDYFAQDVAPSPLLHYWSLGVEEQFYLFWPLFIVMGAKLLGLARLWWLVAAVALGSFVLSVYVTHLDAPWAFYSLPTRAWQLALGALTALGVPNLKHRLGWRSTSMAGLGGLALIAAGVLFVTDAVPYPGFAALLPAGGAALLIISGEGGSSVSARILATGPMRWLGRISYSLYLWHWPILILVPQLVNRHGLPTRIALMVAAVVVAWLSTRHIEAPFRFGAMAGSTSRRTIALSGAASLVIALAATVAAVDFIPALSSAGGSRPTPVPIVDHRQAMPEALLSGPLPPTLQSRLREVADERPTIPEDGCDPGDPGAEPRPECVYGDPHGSMTVVLLGDSHAAQWVDALDRVAQARRWRLIPITKNGCPIAEVPVWNARRHRERTACEEWRPSALAQVADLEPSVVIVGVSRGYELVDDHGPVPLLRATGQWQAGMEGMLARLTTLADRVVLLADTPMHRRSPLGCLSSANAIEECENARSILVSRRYSRLEKQVAVESGSVLIDANKWLCPGQQCPLIMGDWFVYRDTSHLSVSFAADVLAPQLAWELDQLLGLESPT